MKRDSVKVRPYPTLEEIFAAAARTVPASRVSPLPPVQARAGLLALLDRWETLCATPGMQAKRHGLADKILDVFSSFPDQAPGWERAWWKLHPTQDGEGARR